MIISVPQVYYWKVDFEDGTHLAQFDEFGNEILIRNIAGPECFKYNPTTKQNDVIKLSNYFSEYERLHGRVTKISLVPFDSQLAEKAAKKQANLVCLVTTASIITKDVPAECYATFERHNLIHYTTDNGGAPYGELHSIDLLLIHRQTHEATKFEVNLKPMVR